eukprot:m51a1_g1126 hypothetical protein (91) ;mRNA; r:192863-193320
MSEQWHKGLCICNAHSSARTRYDSSNCCFNCLCLTIPLARNIIREGYRIEGNWVKDICAGIFLGPCTVAQLLNEVDHRGKVAPTPADMKK